MLVVTLTGRKAADQPFVAVDFPVRLPVERLVVRELVATGLKLAEGDAAAVAFLRLSASAVVLCCPDLGRAFAEETNVTFARCGYSALTYGGAAYAWLAQARGVDDEELVDAAKPILSACRALADGWSAEAEAQTAARKDCLARRAPGTAGPTG